MTLSERRPRNVGGLALAVVAAIAVGLSACSGAATPSGPTGPPATSQLGATGGEAATTSTDVEATPLLATATAATSPSTGPIVVDPSLLRVLPVSVAGIAMQASPESSAGMIHDPSLAQSASAIAVGVVVAPGNATSDDLAVSSVIQLRPGVFNDAFYRDWRATYDAAACAPAGGVSSHVTQMAGPHTVEMTICVQGARTYHTHLSGDILVSVTAVGDHDFGDLVMSGLRG